MKKLISVLAAVVLLCGCSQDNVQVPDVSTNTAGGTYITEITEGTGVTASAYISENHENAATAESTGIIKDTEAITVTFAKREPVWTTAPVTSETEAATVLEENQLEYRDSQVAVLMEFTGAETLCHYPRAVAYPEYRETYYVLHSTFTVENLSHRSFDFIPQKMIIRGRQNETWSMMPITYTDTGLAASDKFYSIDLGENVTFDVDFVGERECIENACEIVYGYIVNCYPNNIDYEKCNNVTAAKGFDVTDRIAVKKAVRKALEITESAPLPDRLTPAQGEYLADTEKNSYCFTVEKLEDGEYIRVCLRLVSVTNDPEIFDPMCFRLEKTNGKLIHPLYYSFDLSLVENTPTLYYEKGECGFSEDIYGFPFRLYVGPDNKAEYVFYYSYDEGDEFCKFIYDGDNDSFEKDITIK